jgi:hypothetical protein
MKTDWKQPNRRRLTQVLALGWIGTLLMLALPQISLAATAAEINRDVDIALKTLY